MNKETALAICSALVIAIFSALLSGCIAYPEIRPDPAKPHHGDGVFVGAKKGSFFGHFFMRMREGDPPPPTADEIRSITGEADLDLIASAADVPRVTWIGHATALVQYRDINFLTDPHLTQYPFRYEIFVEPRYTQPAMSFEQLPPIDFVVISHNHYDSLDHRTVERFGDSVLWYVPLGLKAWFVDLGIAAARVIELDWWDSHRYRDAVDVTLVPAQHWSKRTPWDSNRTLWGGWVVDIDGFKTYFAGDTGYHDSWFKEIGRRLGPFRLALIPIGAYAPRYFMGPAHVDPAEAVNIHVEVDAEQSLAIHWGTFLLTIEPPLEPPARLRAELARRGLDPATFRAVRIGDTLILD